MISEWSVKPKADPVLLLYTDLLFVKTSNLPNSVGKEDQVARKTKH